jgi:dipeptide/tripeptide permease
MNGQIGSYIIKPDQMQVVNAAFILFLIPLFDGIIYPLFAKYKQFFFVKKEKLKFSTIFYRIKRIWLVKISLTKKEDVEQFVGRST